MCGTITADELKAILSKHEKWLESNGEEGERADLSSGRFVTGDSFVDADLSRAVCKGTDFRRQNLSGVNFYEANLEEAIFSGATLRRVRFTQANLRDAVFTEGETTCKVEKGQLGMTNLKRAVMPDRWNEDQCIASIDESSKSGRWLFQFMLSTCAFTSLTVITTTHLDLLTNRTALPLPLWNAHVPIAGFYFIAAVLLMCQYVYFHLYLQKNWETLVRIPAVFPDGRRVDKVVSPWMLNDLVLVFCKHLKEHRPPYTWLKMFVIYLLAWAAVPMTLIALWARYLTRHDPLGTWVHFGMVFLSLALGVVFFSIAVRTLRGLERPRKEPDSGLPRKRRIAHDIFVALLVATIPFIAPFDSVSFDRFLGLAYFLSCYAIVLHWLGRRPNTTRDRVIARDWGWLRVFLFPSLLVLFLLTVRCFKINDWRSGLILSMSMLLFVAGTYCLGCWKLKRGYAWLRSREGRQRFLLKSYMYAFLIAVSAGVTSMHLLSRDVLEGKPPIGEFRLLILRSWTPSALRLVGLAPYARLFEADVSRRYTHQQDGQTLVYIRGAELRDADLRYASGDGAYMAKADLRGADLRHARFRHANFEGANFDGAQIDTCDIFYADMRGVKGLLVDDIKLAKAYKFAYWSPYVNLQLGLASDHNSKLDRFDLSGYSFAGLDLSDLDLSRHEIAGAKFYSADLRGARFSGANLESAVFFTPEGEAADLQGADFRGAVGLTRDQIIGAISYCLAYYDPDMLFELGLPDNHTERLNQRNLKDYNFSASDMSGADLPGYSLSTATMADCNLRSTIFQDADLSYADLAGADLRSAVLQDADCSFACFKNADIDSANMSETDLGGANVQGARMIRCEGLEASQLKLARNYPMAYLDSALAAQMGLGPQHNRRLKDRKLDHLVFQDINFRDARFEGFDLTGSTFVGVAADRARFENTILDSVSFQGISLKGSVFDGVDLSTTRGLTQDQINEARFIGDINLPEGLYLPNKL